MLHAPSSFRKTAFALTTAAALAVFAAFPAAAQQVAANPPATQSQGVPTAECGAFGTYLLDEAKTYHATMSKTFLLSAGRFLKAGCAASDKDGPIQIITETNQDAASLLTARTLMGKFDILARSGVVHCDRPPNGICPTPASTSLAVGNGS